MKTSKVSVEQICELAAQIQRGRVTGRVVQELIDRAVSKDCGILFEDALDVARSDVDSIGGNPCLRINVLCAIASASGLSKDFAVARQVINTLCKKFGSVDAANTNAEFAIALFSSDDYGLRQEGSGIMEGLNEGPGRERVAVAFTRLLCKNASWSEDPRPRASKLTFPKYRFQALLAIAEASRCVEDIGAARVAAQAIKDDPYLKCNALISILALSGNNQEDLDSVWEAKDHVTRQILPFIYARFFTAVGVVVGTEEKFLVSARRTARDNCEAGFQRAHAFSEIAAASNDSDDIQIAREQLREWGVSKSQQAMILTIIAKITKKPEDFEATYISANGVGDSYDRAVAFVRLAEVLKENIK